MSQHTQHGPDEHADLPQHHARALARGLQAFDDAVARRRAHRRVGGMAALALVATVGAFLLLWTPAPAPSESPVAHRALPDYVELITDDTQLAMELERTDACERIARRGDRLFVVECSSIHDSPPDEAPPQ